MKTSWVAVMAMVVGGGCGDLSPAGPAAGFPDGGTGGGIPTTGDAGLDPLLAAATCTSGRYWTFGEEGSSHMHPGRACIDCHSTRSSGEDDHGPLFSIAGTLYPTGHEPDDCDGVDGNRTGAVVEITDAMGQVLKLTPNRAGNFYYDGSISYPFTAAVLQDGKVRAMATHQTSGDCNSCHTQQGSNAAPGRIVLPFL